VVQQEAQVVVVGVMVIMLEVELVHQVKVLLEEIRQEVLLHLLQGVVVLELLVAMVQLVVVVQTQVLEVLEV